MWNRKYKIFIKLTELLKLFPQILVSCVLLVFTNSISLDWTPFSNENLFLIECVVLIGICTATAYVSHRIAKYELSLFYIVIYGLITGMLAWVIIVGITYFQTKANLNSLLVPNYYNEILLKELYKITAQRMLIITPLLILAYWLIQTINKPREDDNILDGEI